jgi:carboxypeptidase Q
LNTPKTRRKGIIPLLSWFLPLGFVSLSISASAFGQAKPSDYNDLAAKITRKGMEDLGAFAVLEKLTRGGPRLTGSPRAAAAVELMRQVMQDLGLDDVHLEPTVVGRWVRGETEEGRLVSTRLGTIPLAVCALGGSVATPEQGLCAHVVEVKSSEELKALGEKARGKIVFFNRPMDPASPDTFRSYGGAADQRVRGAAEAANAGGVAALVRSLTFGENDDPHTGLMTYEGSRAEIPGLAISTLGANALSEALKLDPELLVYLRTSCATLDPVTSFNVSGEIRGVERPDEVILLGAHLDSWDQGEGAHDDGAGCAHVIEALRLLKLTGARPRRTIRGVLFMDEEFGGTGGRDYARSERRRDERHLAAVESDRGGFLPVGFGVGGGEKPLQKVRRWRPLFEPLGIHWIKPGGGGVDIGPLALSGTVLMGIVPDSQRYFDVHHCRRDVLASVHPRELELGAIACAILAYLLAEEGI